MNFHENLHTFLQSQFTDTDINEMEDELRSTNIKVINNIYNLSKYYLFNDYRNLSISE
jgi:hypothetical protein